MSNVDQEVARLRADLDQTRRELDALRAELAEQVTTRRLVVVDEYDRPVVYTTQLDHAVELAVEHFDHDDGVKRLHEHENVVRVALHAGHESGSETGWNLTVDGDIAAAAMAYGDDAEYIGKPHRRVTSYLTLESGLSRSGSVSADRTNIVDVDPVNGIELRSSRRSGGMVARPRFEITAASPQT